MQYSILKMFQQIANPFMDSLANLLSLLGEQYVMIVIILIVYYGIDKKKGFSIFSSMFISLIAVNGIKAIVRAPRPFVVHPDLVSGRLETATGYSFPSGHTAGAASFYPAIGRAFKSTRLLVSALILALLIGFSRMYLAVHWPIDVLVGYLIGAVCALFLVPVFMKLYENKAACLRYSLVTAIIASIATVLLALLLSLGAVDETAFTDLMKMTAIAAGAYAGCLLEKKMTQFLPAGNVKGTVINILASAVGIALIMALKLLFPEPLYALGAAVRYSLLGLWLTGVYPLIAVKAGMLKSEEK